MLACDETSKQKTAHVPRIRTGTAAWTHHVRAAAVFVFIVVNLSFWICPLMVLVLLKWLLPFSRVRQVIYRWMSWVYQSAVWCHDRVFFGLMGIRLEAEGLAEAYPGEFYLVTANHLSWSDIFLLQHLLNRRAPVMKFLVKRELIYLPLVGLICWAYDYPFLRRRSLRAENGAAGRKNDDTDNLSKALKRFMRSKASIVSFTEGTRYSASKAKKQSSPYRHLLKPKAGGLTAIFDMLGSRLEAVVDVTIVYDDPCPSFWRFIGGRIRRIKIRVETIPFNNVFKPEDLEQGRVAHAAVADWINRRWVEKDRKISRMLKQLTP